MSFTYVLSTDVGKVRLLIPDREGTAPSFQDEELTAFLDIEGGTHRAAALALETLAADAAATLRVPKTLGLDVDGVRASAELLKRAAGLRQQASAAEDAAAAAAGESLFDWAELVVEPFGARERRRSQALREAV
jgi:hypothetical protein